MKLLKLFHHAIKQFSPGGQVVEMFVLQYLLFLSWQQSTTSHQELNAVGINCAHDYHTRSLSR